MTANQQWLRALPQIDSLMGQSPYEEWTLLYGRRLVIERLKTVVDKLRQDLIHEAFNPQDQESLLSFIEKKTQQALETYDRSFYKPVVNATGIVLHTNLGRAPLAEQAVEALVQMAGHYFNLEYDLETGRRGQRHLSIEQLLRDLTGSEAAVVVNNNAAAVVLVLQALTASKEVVISRGELVEVGGGFRIPEVMAASGAILREVGTTNKTHLSDYSEVINDRTSAVIKVHTSNFKISGFTSQPERSALIELCRAHGLLYIEDLGSGQLLQLPETVYSHEPTVKAILSLGADLVTFSGDKLLGGPQCGIIAGKAALIAKIKAHPLMRAMRADKLTLAALEATLKLYTEEDSLYDIPAVAMLSSRPVILELKAKAILEDIEEAFLLEGIELNPLGFTMRLCPDESEAGGGSLPAVKLPTTVIAIEGEGKALNELQLRLRHLDIPIIAKIKDQSLRLDPRTLLTHDRQALVNGLVTVLKAWS